MCANASTKILFQSTLPRRERRGNDRTLVLWWTISIHAPAKGATEFGRRLKAVIRISIHAPAKGATPSGDCRYTIRSISIHAPAKGATRLAAKKALASSNFNPRSREGSDASLSPTLPSCFPDFNPRSREGSDLCFLLLIVNKCHFNPRSREGSDQLQYDLLCGL